MEYPPNACMHGHQQSRVHNSGRSVSYRRAGLRLRRLESLELPLGSWFAQFLGDSNCCRTNNCRAWAIAYCHQIITGVHLPKFAPLLRDNFQL